MNRREFVALAAAAPFALRSTLAAAAAAPFALVTCDEESRLAVVELGAFKIARWIATPPGPRAIELVGSRAVVAHWALGKLSIVDAHRVLHVLEDVSEPRYAAAHPDGVHAFVTDSGYGLVAVDVLRGRAVGRVKLPGWPRHVTLDPTGKTLWVGLGTSSTQVAVVDVIDPRRPRRVALVTPPFGAHDVGFSPDGREVWVTSGAAGETAIYSAGRSAARDVQRRGGVRNQWRRGNVACAVAFRRSRRADDADPRRLLQRAARPWARDHALALARDAGSSRRARCAARDRPRRGVVPRRVFRARLRVYESLTAGKGDLYAGRGT